MWLVVVVLVGIVTSTSNAFEFSLPRIPRRSKSLSPRLAMTSTSSAEDSIAVAVTREDGNNKKLLKALESRLAGRISVLEVPCIAHADGEDYALLAEKLRSERWDYVAVTSPQAAIILNSAWDSVRDDPIPVTAVGKATSEALEEYGIAVSFCPSKAIATTLMLELPATRVTDATRVLYPASAKARTTLENGLRERGFEVVRLNAYDTVSAHWTHIQRTNAEKCQVACFGSPSAVDGWLRNSNNNTTVLAACIGKTSADVCRDRGWPKECIFFPDKPGIEGWINVVEEAVDALVSETA
uniref:Uroporphyrinogen-III synthase n=1 Tax=Phaeodactylum tricornutum TaxID=2850 RepID=A0A8J9TX28_PHATR